MKWLNKNMNVNDAVSSPLDGSMKTKYLSFQPSTFSKHRGNFNRKLFPECKSENTIQKVLL